MANFTGVIPADTIKNVDCNTAMALTRSKLALESKQFALPLESWRVHDAMGSLLPSAASADDLGLSSGTFGSAGTTLVSVDYGGTTTTAYCRRTFQLPAEYEDGGSISFVAWAGAGTTVGDTSLTLDCEVYAKSEADATEGSDLCTTGAQDINDLTIQAQTYAITPTGLVSGDELDIRLTVAGSDTGDLGVMTAIITKTHLLCQVRG